MNIAFCYESVLPARGGCETYIADLARRLAADGHELHLYARRWDADALPESLHYHPLTLSQAPRFVRPWLFAAACHRALAGARHDVTVGFDKTWGQDVLFPQGGLHAASADHNLLKHSRPAMRFLARWAKRLDLAHWSYCLLERRQYLRAPRPIIVVNSRMVCDHFQHYYRVSAADLRVIHSAIDPDRFREHDRLRRRQEWRTYWGFRPGDIVAAFVAMNYHLKGLDPLLHAVRRIPQGRPFRLLVAGHPMTARYERLAQRLGVAERVRFAGYCPDTRNAYFAADFLVHPTFYDPCSLVALEALACGLPVITTRYNGASELLHPPQDGFVIDNPHEHEELAEAIGQLLDSKRRAECTHAARRAALQWTFEHHYRCLLEVFTEAAARKKAA